MKRLYLCISFLITFISMDVNSQGQDSVSVKAPSGSNSGVEYYLNLMIQKLQDSASAIRTRIESKVSAIDNTSDADKPISNSVSAALANKAPIVSPTLVTPVIGVASGTSLSLTGNATTSGGVIGYATGAGGTVTQNANKSQGVTLNKPCGQITMNGAALTAGSEVAFTLTNSFIASTDVVIVNVQSVGTAGAYLVSVGAVSAGSCSITVSNASAGSLSQALVLNFCVIKGSSN